jgi:S1-C subfamily serine protease
MGLVEQLHIGHKYAFDVLRNGKESHPQVTVKELPHEPGQPTAHRTPGVKPSPEHNFGDLGIEVGALNSDAARQLGYANAAGVAIIAVEPGSPASDAGLQEGMMIDKVGQQPVTTVDEFHKALEGQSLEAGFLLLIRTPRGSQFVVLSKGESRP